MFTNIGNLLWSHFLSNIGQRNEAENLIAGSLIFHSWNRARCVARKPGLQHNFFQYVLPKKKIRKTRKIKMKKRKKTK